MSRIDIMVDIETLGKEDYSPIFQIASCAFDISTGEIISSFNKICDISIEKTLPIEGSTLKWWMNTNKDLLLELLNSGVGSQEQLFLDFNEWLLKLGDSKMSNVFLWGNGMLFDNRLIKAKMKQYNIEYPIFYRNDRDMRTIVELASIKLNIGSEKEFRDKFKSEKYIEHDGFDDVKSQIEILSKAWNIVLS